jgi:hypothetical protein
MVKIRVSDKNKPENITINNVICSTEQILGGENHYEVYQYFLSRFKSILWDNWLINILFRVLTSVFLS